jgi:tryptophan-rich sensory protein
VTANGNASHDQIAHKKVAEIERKLWNTSKMVIPLLLLHLYISMTLSNMISCAKTSANYTENLHIFMHHIIQILFLHYFTFVITRFVCMELFVDLVFDASYWCR